MVCWRGGLLFLSRIFFLFFWQSTLSLGPLLFAIMLNTLLSLFFFLYRFDILIENYQFWAENNILFSLLVIESCQWGPRYV